MPRSPRPLAKTDIANETRARRMDQVIDLIQRAGYLPSGWTEQRVIAENEDGSVLTTPPRRRFYHRLKNDYVTVGLKLVYFYRRIDGETEFLASFNTPDIDLTAGYLLQTRV